jgi:ferredoxin
MIVAEQKPLEEIKALIGNAQNVLVVGCGTCVTVCFAGGAAKAAIVSSSLADGDSRLEKNPKNVRRCDRPAPVRMGIPGHHPKTRSKGRSGAFAWLRNRGAGNRRTLSRDLGRARLNTKFLGLPTEQGIWAERCAACGDCILGLTGGICPIARCSKSLLNGPCGGSEDGHCEISDEVPCAWQLIYDRLSSMNKLDVDGNTTAQELAHLPRRWAAQDRAGRPAPGGRGGVAMSWKRKWKRLSVGIEPGARPARRAFRGHRRAGPAAERRRQCHPQESALLEGYCDAVNITDNQTAIVRMSSIGAGRSWSRKDWSRSSR